MIRVLIVEDDQLVRKGLVSAMPWSEYNMQVIGEMSNGLKALEFLEEQDADLIFTDVEMPVMSGIEMIKALKEQENKAQFVILTMYQDFNLAQEAIRLDVLDFVAKVELDSNNFDSVLKRVYNQYIKIKSQTPSSTVNGYQDQCIFYLHHSDEKEALEKKLELKAPHLSSKKIDNLIYSISVDNKTEIMQFIHEVDCKIPRLIIENIEDDDWIFYVKKLYSRFSFYSEQLDDPLIKQYKEIVELENYQMEFFTSIHSSLQHHKWLFDNELFQSIMDDIVNSFLSVEILSSILDRVFENLKIKFPLVTDMQLNHDSLVNFSDVQATLDIVRTKIKMIHGKNYSDNVLHTVLEAVEYIQEHFNEHLTADKIAARFFMSKSYFNQALKDYLGLTFHNYVKKLRMEKAKEMLLFTDKPIQYISEMCGYQDEKYFSRTFKKYYDSLPSTFRKINR